MQVVSYERCTRDCERLREFACCLNCSSCSLCDGLCFELGWRRGSRTIVGAGCARVVRTLTWWGELDVSCRVMSGHVGSSRLKSGKVGRNFFLPVLVFVTLLHQFFLFESRFPVLAGSLRCSSTALTDDRLMPICWRRGAVRRVWKGHVGLGRVRAGSFPCFGLCQR